MIENHTYLCCEPLLRELQVGQEVPQRITPTHNESDKERPLSI
jgi:hypothetical protein